MLATLHFFTTSSHGSGSSPAAPWTCSDIRTRVSTLCMQCAMQVSCACEQLAIGEWAQASTILSCTVPVPYVVLVVRRVCVCVCSCVCACVWTALQDWECCAVLSLSIQSVTPEARERGKWAGGGRPALRVECAVRNAGDAAAAAGGAGAEGRMGCYYDDVLRCCWACECVC